MDLALAIVEAVGDVALVAIGAIGTFWITRWSAANQVERDRDARSDERRYTESREALAGELALEREILARTKTHVLHVIAIDMAARTNNWHRADQLMSLAGARPFDPDPPHLALINDPDVRDRWDAVLIDSQRAILEHQAGKATWGDPTWLQELLTLSADLMALFHDQDRRLARNEPPLRLIDTPERKASRAAMVAEMEQQMAGIFGQIPEPSDPPEASP